MDKTFASSPLDLRTWTKDFVYSHQKCPIITKYSQYEDYPNSGHCFVFLSSVHYWQPYQLKKLEDEGVRQVEWTRYSLEKAYRNAIGIFSRVPRRD
jgi:hypothetical protein